MKQGRDDLRVDRLVTGVGERLSWVCENCYAEAERGVLIKCEIRLCGICAEQLMEELQAMLNSAPCDTASKNARVLARLEAENKHLRQLVDQFKEAMKE